MTGIGYERSRNLIDKSHVEKIRPMQSGPVDSRLRGNNRSVVTILGRGGVTPAKLVLGAAGGYGGRSESSS